MKVNAVSFYNNQQKTNPNFGIKLNIDPNMQYFVQKEALNLASKEGKDAHHYLKGFLGMFIKGMREFAGVLNNLEPKEMNLLMGLTNKGMEYISSPRLDGNLFSQQTAEKPVYLGFMNPMDPQGNLLAKPVDFPYTGAKAMENMEDIVNLVSVYKDMVKYKEGNK